MTDNEMIKSCEPIVKHFCNRWSAIIAKKGGDYDEAMQHGRMGAWRALQKWDGERKFHTYATWWIRAGVYRYLERIHPAMRIARRKGEYEKVYVVSLDQYVEGTDDVRYAEMIPDENIVDTDTLLSQRQMIAKMESHIERHFKPKYREVARRRLFTANADTLEDIGSDIGTTRERVRQMESTLKNSLAKFAELV